MVKKPDFLLKDDEVRETLKITLNFLKVCTCTYEFLVTFFLSKIFCLVIALSLAMTSDRKTTAVHYFVHNNCKNNLHTHAYCIGE